MAIGMAIAAGGGAALGILSAWAQAKAQAAEFAYRKKLKVRQDSDTIADLRKAGHDALISKELLRRQNIGLVGDIDKQVADAVSKTVVQQAAWGVTGNTANRITNSIMGEGGDMTTDLDLEARAEYDNIDEQLRTLTTQAERQLESNVPVDFSTSLGTALQIATGATGGASSGLSLYSSYQNLQAK